MKRQIQNTTSGGKNMTQTVFERLARPFDPKHIKWRIGARTKDQSKGIALAYVDARMVMRRFDDVLGPGNWQNRYTHVTPQGVICEIGIRLDSEVPYEWLWRANGAGETDVEAEKGAMSDAFKRAAVMWGVARYLYALPNKWYPLENGRRFIEQPELPAWATPEFYDEKILTKRGEV